MKPIDCKPLYDNPEYYDLQNNSIVDDIPFFLKQIEKYGDPVLELACGTGRITIPIAEEGIDISGLDIIKNMLSYAKSKAKAKNIDIEWIEADCRDFNIDKKFSIIFFPFNSIAHIHDLESIEACFSCVRKHLKHNGKFIIDMFNPSLDRLTRSTFTRYPVANLYDAYNKETLTIMESNSYDADTQINRIKWYYKKNDQTDEIVNELNMRIYYPQEIDALLKYNGFTIENKFGNYDESPFLSASPKQLIICNHVK